jgi:hypothetical protein
MGLHGLLQGQIYFLICSYLKGNASGHSGLVAGIAMPFSLWHNISKKRQGTILLFNVLNSF